MLTNAGIGFSNFYSSVSVNIVNQALEPVPPCFDIAGWIHDHLTNLLVHSFCLAGSLHCERIASSYNRSYPIIIVFNSSRAS